jgi:hypothetical protein
LPQNTKSDSSKTESILEGLKDELLDMLDKARNLEDLVQSLKAQKHIIEALLTLLE